ncbi:Flp pilus assembly protein CpaB [Flavimaricola marinus]|uniref:SAF domain protein n=1 Tax=Flavimaricola marinus TaxID=1819565 RepID=A0A238LB39_9RHOB|nr:Flp pilus assembly protein CpaB [Flavimaricola marinus]SMY06130.1 SAF domain protein [Flavimaricola marinus]
MRIASLIIALSGVAVAGGSVYVAQDYLQQQSARNSAGADGALVTVVVAGRDIALGQILESQLLRTIDWPRGSVPEGVFTDLNDLIAAPGGDPRRARRAIAEGELVLMSRVSDFGEKVTIVQSLAAGHRAMAIEVAAETAVGGFVTPGDFVDVVLTHGRNDSLRAVTILQNVRVIGVDQDSDERSDTPGIARTVTLEVDPTEGQRLALAQQAGTLSLSLRAEASELDAPIVAINLADLLQDVSPVPEAEARAPIVVRRANVLDTDL